MPSVKRSALLSDLEKERLEKRITLDAHVRSTNDMRIRRKLANWLSSVDDVLLILERLPKDDIQKVATDTAVLRTATASVELMRLMGYRPIVGEVGQPEGWQAIAKRGVMLDDYILTPANDVDIIRSANLTLLTSTLETMLGYEKNPVAAAITYDILKGTPPMEGFLKDHPNLKKGYQRALARIREAGVTFASSSLPVYPSTKK